MAARHRLGGGREGRAVILGAGVSVEKYLWIGLGGFLGANARFLVGTWALEKWGPNFPAGTLLVNVTGSFLLGVTLAITAGRLGLDPRLRLLLAVGFMGAYTTFSTYAYETAQLLLTGTWWPGIISVLANNAVSVAAAVLGLVVGRNL